MRLVEVFERVRMHCGNVHESDILMLLNRFCFDFVMRTKYGTQKIDEPEEISQYYVIKLTEGVVEDNKVSILGQCQNDLNGVLVTYPNAYYISVNNQRKAMLWKAAGDKILVQDSFDEKESVELYGCFWKDLSIIDNSGEEPALLSHKEIMELELDDVIGMAVLNKVFSEIFYRNPETIPIAEKYEMKYERDIKLTQRRFNAVTTTATLKPYDM